MIRSCPTAKIVRWWCGIAGSWPTDSIDLKGMPGSDKTGAAGLEDETDHRWQFAGALAVSTLLFLGPSIAEAIAQNGNNGTDTNVYTGPATALGSNTSIVGENLLNRELNRPCRKDPTQQCAQPQHPACRHPVVLPLCRHERTGLRAPLSSYPGDAEQAAYKADRKLHRPGGDGRVADRS
jgi:hypothetical protein